MITLAATAACSGVVSVRFAETTTVSTSPAICERDLGVGRSSEIRGARLKAGLFDTGLALVDSTRAIHSEAAFGVAVDRLALTRHARRFHRPAGWIENSAVKLQVFARAKPERQRQ